MDSGTQPLASQQKHALCFMLDGDEVDRSERDSLNLLEGSRQRNIGLGKFFEFGAPRSQGWYSFIEFSP